MYFLSSQQVRLQPCVHVLNPAPTFSLKFSRILLGGSLRIGRASKGSNADTAAAAVLAEVAPLCFGHQEPTRVVVVKKTGPNKGRRFFSCCRPREDQCDFFM